MKKKQFVLTVPAEEFSDDWNMQEKVDKLTMYIDQWLRSSDATIEEIKPMKPSNSPECPACRGTGFAKGSQMGELVDCPQCQGKGVL